MAIFRFILLLCLFFNAHFSISQNGKLPPFQLQIQAINGTNLPGLHSFAFAQAGNKWLFIGGRTNGLHGLNNNDGFPLEYKNNDVIVIDTSSWNFYKASLDQLPATLADPLRSTNMQSIQNGDYLYMAGGYGWDSMLEEYVTFPTLTAVHVDKIIDAVINSKPLSTSIRQITDTNLQICGGELAKLGNDFYLMMGHNFNGRYDSKPSVLFSQVYSNCIKKFTLTDDGTTIALSNFSYLVDTANFHRRDLTVCPLIKPDGSFAIGSYGGVFKKTRNLPFLEPIILSSDGTSEVTSYQQLMSQYTCAVLPVYDAAAKNMYTTFFGGISLHDYDAANGTIKQDTLMPFINDITTLSSFANGSFEERVLPLQLPGLLGSNAKFILNKAIPAFANEVIDLNQLPKTPQLVGYIIGGIHAQQGNLGQSVANRLIYRVYLTPVPSTGMGDEARDIQHMRLFPNPTAGNPVLEFTVVTTGKVKVCVTDLTGKEFVLVTNDELQKGIYRLPINISACPTGFYLCEVQSSTGKLVQKLIVNK